MAGDDGGRDGTGGIHGRAGDRPGKHGFQSDDRADGNSRGDAFFFRAGGDVEDDEHEKEGEDEFEDERLHGRTGRQCRAEEFVRRKKKAQQAAGQKGPGKLADDVGQNERAFETLRCPKADGDSGIQMRAGDVAEGIDHGEDNQAEGQSDADVGDCALAGLIDDDCASPGKDEGERAEEFGAILFHGGK